MTTTTDWHEVGPIAANDDTRDMWRQPDWLWRIRTPDGAITCPSVPTVQRTGTLLRRRAIPVGYYGAGQGVGTHALSTGPLT